MSDQEPPHDVAPRAFFEAWLPAAFARAFAGGRRIAEVQVRVILEGATGGAWDLCVRKGQLDVAVAGTGATPVTVRQTVEDWRATLVADETAGVSMRPPRGSPLDILFVDPQLRALLEPAPSSDQPPLCGSVRLEVSGYAGRTWWMQVQFGGVGEAAEPDAVISMTAATFQRLKEKTLLPPQAYFAGLVTVSGDTALAMQTAMAILPRFTG